MGKIETDWEHRHQTEQMKAVMGKDMETADFFKSGEARFSSVIKPFAGDLATASALEIGCGPGRILRAIATEAGKAIGVDVSDTACATARKNLAQYDNVEIVKNDGAGLDGIESDSVDLVVSFDVFQHIPTFAIQQAYLRETARVLKPDGKFVIQVKTDSGWLRLFGIPLFPRRFRSYVPGILMDFALKLSGIRDDRLKDTWRGHLIPHRELTQVFARNGLKVADCLPDGKGLRWIVRGYNNRQD